MGKVTFIEIVLSYARSQFVKQLLLIMDYDTRRHVPQFERIRGTSVNNADELQQ